MRRRAGAPDRLLAGFARSQLPRGHSGQARRTAHPALQDEQREILSTSHSLVRQVLYWQGQESVHEEVETLEGAGLLYERVGEPAYFARRELLVMHPSSTLTPECAAMARESDLRCLRRGVTVRALVHRSALRDPVSAEHFREVIEHGAQLRVLGGPFERVLIFDRSTALVQSVPDAPDQRAVLIRQGLVQPLRSFFDRSWDHAADVAALLGGGAERDRLEEFQLKVLQIMARTDKDEACFPVRFAADQRPREGPPARSPPVRSAGSGCRGADRGPDRGPGWTRDGRMGRGAGATRAVSARRGRPGDPLAGTPEIPSWASPRSRRGQARDPVAGQPLD